VSANHSDTSRDEQPLGSWKEIGSYLQRNEATARRWEREEGLPVHRHPHKIRSSVYAYPSEIDAWRASRKAAPEPAPVRPLWKIPAFALTMLLCLIMVGNGVRPVSAQQDQPTARQIFSSDTLVAPGSPSRDGRYLPFTDRSTGDLVIRDMAAGTSRRVPNVPGSKGVASDPAISPDGRQVVYVFIDKDYSLRVAPLDGGQLAQPRVLLRQSTYIQPHAWTPDGKQIIVTRTMEDATTQIAMVSVRDGSVHVIKSLLWEVPESVSISPDGRYLAYDASPSQGLPHDIFVLAVDGRRETAAVEGPASDYHPLWSPDGSRLVFLSTRTGTSSLWTLPVKDGRPIGAPELVRAYAASPLGFTRDGTLLYQNSGTRAERNNVYLADLDQTLTVSKPAGLAGLRFIGSNHRAAWSPDGKNLAYFSFRERADYPTRLQSAVIVVQTIATGQERDVPIDLPVAPGDAAAPPKWFPDGRSVLVVSNEGQRPGHGYYRVDLASGKGELLHRTTGSGRGPNHPDLSANGKTIFYIDSDGPASFARLMRFDIAAQRETEVKHATAGQSFTSVAVSPDGAQLAYLVSDRAESTSLVVMPAQTTGEPRELFRAVPWTGNVRFGVLAWTPDGRNLLFVRPAGADAQELWSVPAAGGEARKTGISMSGIKSPALQPGGSRIVFSTFKAGVPEIWVLENFLPKANGK
jgi:Tol biopolymer transport system component